MSICFLIVNAAEIGKEITNLKIKSINIADFLNKKKKKKVTSSNVVMQMEKKIIIIQEESLGKNDTTDVQYNVVNKALKNR